MYRLETEQEKEIMLLALKHNLENTYQYQINDLKTRKKKKNKINKKNSNSTAIKKRARHANKNLKP